MNERLWDSAQRHWDNLSPDDLEDADTEEEIEEEDE